MVTDSRAAPSDQPSDTDAPSRETRGQIGKITPDGFHARWRRVMKLSLMSTPTDAVAPSRTSSAILPPFPQPASSTDKPFTRPSNSRCAGHSTSRSNGVLPRQGPLIIRGEFSSRSADVTLAGPGCTRRHLRVCCHEHNVRSVTPCRYSVRHVSGGYRGSAAPAAPTTVTREFR